ncbi:MAG: hypothetical protein K8R58_08665 [Bacteroidales bacterium]|nr:hypothetical protein [Bacteroidales bacterium]
MNFFNNFIKYENFRKKYTYIIYESYSISINKSTLYIQFNFNLADKYFFTPTLKFHRRDFYLTDNLTKSELNNIGFHIGMIELISYWKAACPPKIIIKPNYLSKEQIDWWKKLYFNGLGEFFYVNKIYADKDNFVEIIADSGEDLKRNSFNIMNATLIPVGGGKDSVVTLELLSKLNKNNLPLILNPGKASLKTIKAAGFSRNNIIEIHRTIHPQLLKLNDMGFLNGHTPFSALLAFVSILAAILSGRKNIALSNESSANEATVNNTNINHQYSKSFEFENDFRYYVNKYISKDFNYFSFLRPLSEINISKLFSQHSEYFKIFKSCNVGSKTDSWCCKCPKCLFTYIILSPFISQSQLKIIFGKNLFKDSTLIQIFNQLIGIEKNKPFECVGTIDEVNTAIVLTIRKEQKNKLPLLLKYYTTLGNYELYKNVEIEKIFNNFNNKHFLNPEFEKILKSSL